MVRQRSIFIASRVGLAKPPAARLVLQPWTRNRDLLAGVDLQTKPCNALVWELGFVAVRFINSQPVSFRHRIHRLLADLVSSDRFFKQSQQAKRAK